MFRHGLRAAAAASAAAAGQRSAAGARTGAWRGSVASVGGPAASWAWLMQGGRRGYASEGLSEEDISDRVIALLEEIDKIKDTKKEVTAKSHFINDLGLDSLDTVEVVMAIEEEFDIEIPDKEFESIFTPADAINFIKSHPAAK